MVNEPIQFKGKLAFYHWQTERWTQFPVSGYIETQYFAIGSLRAVYHGHILGHPERPSEMLPIVVKVALPDTDAAIQTYYTDIKLQSMAMECAKAFSEHSQIKHKVEIIKAGLLVLDKDLIIQLNSPAGIINTRILHLEERLTGKFTKFTNNMGFIHEDERNTPQAFSHFSYVWSGYSSLICDVQGVAIDGVKDIYTDPQAHTQNNEKLINCLGNLGGLGINAFFSTHKCNAICQALGLESFILKTDDHGTLPHTMSIATTILYETVPNDADTYSEDEEKQPTYNNLHLSQIYGARAVTASLLRGVTEEQLMKITSENITNLETIQLHKIFPPGGKQISNKHSTTGDSAGTESGSCEIIETKSQVPDSKTFVWLKALKPAGFYHSFMCWLKDCHTVALTGEQLTLPQNEDILHDYTDKDGSHDYDMDNIE